MALAVAMALELLLRLVPQGPAQRARVACRALLRSADLALDTGLELEAGLRMVVAGAGKRVRRRRARRLDLRWRRAPARLRLVRRMGGEGVWLSLRGADA